MKTSLLSAHAQPRQRRADAPPGASNSAVASGLVTNSTSDTQRVCILDPVEGRKRRLKRSVQWAARCHTTLTTERVRAFMVTLTYAELDAWAPLHLTAFLKAAREYYRRMCVKFRYVWVGELQQRGAVHYHVLVWLPVRMQMIKPDKRGWWPHGMTRVDRLVKNAVGYVTKYVQKFDSVAQFPKGIRLHGSGGHDATGKQIKSWIARPGWARSMSGTNLRVVRAKGGGLVCTSCGVCLSSPFRVSVGGGAYPVCRKQFEYSGGITDVGGPFSSLHGCVDFSHATRVFPLAYA